MLVPHIANYDCRVGRGYLPQVLKTFLSTTTASTAAPAMASMLIYLLMAALLVWRPTGLFGARN